VDSNHRKPADLQSAETRHYWPPGFRCSNVARSRASSVPRLGPRGEPGGGCPVVPPPRGEWEAGRAWRGTVAQPAERTPLHDPNETDRADPERVQANAEAHARQRNAFFESARRCADAATFRDRLGWFGTHGVGLEPSGVVRPGWRLAAEALRDACDVLGRQRPADLRALCRCIRSLHGPRPLRAARRTCHGGRRQGLARRSRAAELRGGCTTLTALAGRDG